MINALLALLLCQLAGEAITTALNLPLPGPVIGMVFLLAAWEPRTQQKWVRYLRDFDTLFYVIGLFMMTTVLVHRVHPVDYDPQLISIDRSIGGIAVLKWMNHLCLLLRMVSIRWLKTCSQWAKILFQMILILIIMKLK